MTNEKIRDQIANYHPFNEQEEHDQQELLWQIDHVQDLLTRNNRNAHFTASAWIVSPDRQKVLMAYHNIYQSFAWLGGHVDGDPDFKHVISKEITEESGLEDFKFVSDDIFSLEILTVDGHIKRGEYVSSHLHLNVTYLIEADPALPIRIKPDENSAIAWIDLKDLPNKINEPWFYKWIYQKLIQKAAEF
ncbi:NUDIX hydrolase [Lactobacillus pasteurii]|uniref:Adenosylhomocysteinase n=1 Tax=Lactobacillus pasteurii DSM 23907 = CRBIP 24.76 TaxID=1423790 RepID=I7LAM4_9LACO|nr:NUDIX hydrolase [Lactobacillus pasteurii]TDG77286.1 hypothetical protein C5L33_000729 [Lactobacillus pasteurii]CCI84831.1 Adenosylhomocysteinase [Lactobacillus pasteurii DSM 23907 = CRBIP 24.76]